MIKPNSRKAAYMMAGCKSGETENYNHAQKISIPSRLLWTATRVGISGG